jgi:hypothetical protein
MLIGFVTDIFFMNRRGRRGHREREEKRKEIEEIRVGVHIY